LSARAAEPAAAEWHHVGLYAARVVYFEPGRVARFWEAMDAAGVTAADLEWHATPAAREHRMDRMLGLPGLGDEADATTRRVNAALSGWLASEQNIEQDTE
jgi:hypothetical protein